MNATVLALVWMAALFASPLLLMAVSYARLPLERLRGVAVACAALTLAVSALACVVPGLSNVELSVLGGVIGRSLALRIRVDVLSSVLVPLAAALWLLTVAVTPRARLDRGGLRRTAAATALTIAAFLTVSPVLLLVCWVASIAVFLAALGAPEHRRVRRVAAAYLGASALFFVAGVALISFVPAGSTAEGWGLLLILIAALIRKAIFPFHAWLPEVFDRGRLGPAVLFSAPQLGAYVTAVLIVPRASAALLHGVAILALVTAVYGAALSLFQRDARRSCGYLFVSQSALVMAGLDCTSKLALSGALVLWISSALAFTGISRCVLALEARRGRLDLRKHHGGYERMPLLALSFLLMGLACTGFPGTLGFIGQELLVSGAVEAFPLLGFFVIAAGALTGLAVLRMYFSLFCGRRDQGIHLFILPREAVAFAVVAGFLLLSGLAPRPIVASRAAASEGLLKARALRQVSALSTLKSG